MKNLKKNIKKDKTIETENNRMSNVSPLRYPGGKTRACDKLNNILDEHFDMQSFDSIVSPFFGGGSFEFYLQNKHNLKIVANDKFTPLYNFWYSAKTNNDELCDGLIDKMNTTKNNFLEYRRDIMNLNNDVLTQAIYYFIINRCSFSGATLSGGFSEEASKKRFTLSSINRIKNLDLSNFSIHNDNFSVFLKRNFSKNRLLFLDPPYYLEKGSKLYGKNGDMHENFEHEKLYNQIANKKNWLMTYNDCTYIRELYKDFIIIDVDWSYGMNKSKKSSEIVIISK